MSLNADQLYALLPAIYRTRDAQNGGPLQALLAVIAGQSAILEENILQLYDDEFIETCAPWVIPYIGDLIGVNPIYEITGQVSGLRRAEVANTIGYRRRKGTLLALEQVTMDASGRTTAAVEFFKRLITTESMHHVRPRHSATVDLRQGGALERMNTAFDTLNRTIDVRRIAPRVRMPADPDPTPLDINLHGGGRFNIPDIGIYVWAKAGICFPVTSGTGVSREWPAVHVQPARAGRPALQQPTGPRLLQSPDDAARRGSADPPSRVLPRSRAFLWPRAEHPAICRRRVAIEHVPDL